MACDQEIRHGNRDIRGQGAGSQVDGVLLLRVRVRVAVVAPDGLEQLPRLRRRLPQALTLRKYLQYTQS